MAEIDRPEPKRKPARREFKKPEETSCNCVNWAYCKPSKFQTTHPTCLIPLLPPSPTNVDEWSSLPSSLILLIPSENGIGSLVLVLLLVLELRGYKDRKVCLLKRRLLRIKIEVWRSGVAAWDYDTSIAAMPAFQRNNFLQWRSRKLFTPTPREQREQCWMPSILVVGADASADARFTWQQVTTFNDHLHQW